MGLKPGTKEFETELIARLQAETEADTPPLIKSREVYSRNTLIYRLSTASNDVVAKIQLVQNADELANEYEILMDLRGRLSGDVTSLIPVALFPDLSALITIEEQGDPLRKFVDRSIVAQTEGVRVNTRCLTRLAAKALYRFHSRFSMTSDGIVRQYLDYSPRNVLIKDKTNVVLLDPPEREIYGSVFDDLGVFCFDLSRAAFMPNAITRFAGSWLDDLKFEFLSTYMECVGRPLVKSDLTAVRLGEQRRARNALMWYARFYKYSSWPREFARWAYFTPIIGLYLRKGMDVSYKRLEQRLVDG